MPSLDQSLRVFALVKPVGVEACAELARSKHRGSAPGILSCLRALAVCLLYTRMCAQFFLHHPTMIMGLQLGAFQPSLEQQSVPLEGQASLRHRRCCPDGRGLRAVCAWVRARVSSCGIRSLASSIFFRRRFLPQTHLRLEIVFHHFLFSNRLFLATMVPCFLY